MAQLLRSLSAPSESDPASPSVYRHVTQQCNPLTRCFTESSRNISLKVLKASSSSGVSVQLYPFLLFCSLTQGQLWVICTLLSWDMQTSSWLPVIYCSTQTPALCFCTSHPVHSASSHDTTAHLALLQVSVVYFLSLCEGSQMHWGVPKKGGEVFIVWRERLSEGLIASGTRLGSHT